MWRESLPPLLSCPMIGLRLLTWPFFSLSIEIPRQGYEEHQLPNPHLVPKPPITLALTFTFEEVKEIVEGWRMEVVSSASQDEAD